MLGLCNGFPEDANRPHRREAGGPGDQPPRALFISGVLAYLTRHYVVAYRSSRLHRPVPPD
jgi:hypothetical protein